MIVTSVYNWLLTSLILTKISLQNDVSLPEIDRESSGINVILNNLCIFGFENPDS